MLLAWTDIETNGLDFPGLIFEIAVIVTDSKLNVLDCRQFVLGYRTLPKMDQRVIDMHSKSGLLDEVQRSTYTEADVDKLLAAWLKGIREAMPGEFNANWPGFVAAGKGVGRFDMPRVQHHLPATAGQYHYRTFEIDSLRTLMRMKDIEPPARPKENHRAMTDLLQDIAFADHFMHRMLV